MTRPGRQLRGRRRGHGTFCCPGSFLFPPNLPEIGTKAKIQGDLEGGAPQGFRFRFRFEASSVSSPPNILRSPVPCAAGKKRRYSVPFLKPALRPAKKTSPFTVSDATRLRPGTNCPYVRDRWISHRHAPEHDRYLNENARDSLVVTRSTTTPDQICWRVFFLRVSRCAETPIPVC